MTYRDGRNIEGKREGDRRNETDSEKDSREVYKVVVERQKEMKLYR